MKYAGKRGTMVRLFALLLSVVMCGGLISGSPLRVQAEEGYVEQNPRSIIGPVPSYNRASYRYGTYNADPTKSYLFEDQNGNLVRVEYTKSEDIESIYTVGTLIVETYTSEFTYISSLEIPLELELFGGFFAGADANYFVFGQDNTDHLDDREVLRVVKYSKDWERLGDARLYGANTCTTFDDASLRMTEYNGILYIHTGHYMYDTAFRDRRHHQSNWTITVDESTMEILKSRDKPSNQTEGYVSHSFNQFIEVVDGRIVTLDHGDYAPRALVISRYDINEDGTLSVTCDSANAPRIPDNPKGSNLSYNITNYRIGGFEVSDTHYLTAATYESWNDKYEYVNQYNIVLVTNPLNNFLWNGYFPDQDWDADAVKIIPLTNCPASAGYADYRLSCPYMVEVDENTYIIIWEYYVNLRRDSKLIQMVAVDGAGNTISDIMNFTGLLSDCEPLYKDGQLIWYVTGEGIQATAPVFYSFNVTKQDGGVSITQNPTIAIDTYDESELAVRNFVARMYEVALNRRYETAGLEDWTGQLLRHENDGAGIAWGFIMSDEFIERNLSDEDYVDTLYHTFFNRDPDAGGRSGWLESLDLGNARDFVLAGFVNSDEFTNLCAEYGVNRGTLDTAGEGRITANIRDYVLRLYTKALGRDGESAGVIDWSGQIAGGVKTPEEVAKSFFFSEEFLNKGLSVEDYVETLYQTFMDRASDAEGRAYWLDRLANGATTEEVLEGFSRSEEFGKIVAGFGL